MQLPLFLNLRFLVGQDLEVFFLVTLIASPNADLLVKIFLVICRNHQSIAIDCAVIPVMNTKILLLLFNKMIQVSSAHCDLLVIICNAVAQFSNLI